MISIVIPTYNAEKYLAETIISCLDQTYQDYEIIIVNDGSTDETEKIINRFQSNYNKVRSIYKANGGTASALNAGIKSMKGDWFKWLSADDKFSSKHTLKDMMFLISTIPAHEGFMFYTNYNIVDQDSKFVRIFHEPDRTRLTRDLRNAELMFNYYGNGSTTLIHKKLIKKVGLFREGLGFGEDLEYWLRACIKFKYTLYHLPLKTIDYRVHTDSLSASKGYRRKNAKQRTRIVGEYFGYLSEEQKEYLKKLNTGQRWRRKYIPVKIRARALDIMARMK